MALATAGEATVSGLAAGRPMSLAAVSKHLRVLEDAGLIQREVRGRQHFCRLRAAPLAAASEWVELCRRFWEQRLDRLEELLTAAPPDGPSGLGAKGSTEARAKAGGERGGKACAGLGGRVGAAGSRAGEAPASRAGARPGGRRRTR